MVHPRDSASGRNLEPKSSYVPRVDHWLPPELPPGRGCRRTTDDREQHPAAHPERELVNVVWHVTIVKHFDMRRSGKDFSWPQAPWSCPTSVCTAVKHAGKILREQLHVHGPDADVGVGDVVLAGAATCYMA